MTLFRSSDRSAYNEWRVYDAVFMELSAPHPAMSIVEEADLKGRLLRVIEANVTQHEPGELMRLFSGAMSTV